MERQIEKDAADILLERRKRLPLPAPFFLKWFGVKYISAWVKLGTYGTGLRRSSYYASMGIKQDELDNLTVDKATLLFAVHGKALSKMVAVSILNGWISGFLFTRLLALYLRWNAEQPNMFGIVNWLIYYGDTTDFINTIRSAYLLTVTQPMMSHKATGS